MRPRPTNLHRHLYDNDEDWKVLLLILSVLFHYSSIVWGYISILLVKEAIFNTIFNLCWYTGNWGDITVRDLLVQKTRTSERWAHYVGDTNITYTDERGRWVGTYPGHLSFRMLVVVSRRWMSEDHPRVMLLRRFVPSFTLSNQINWRYNIGEAYWMHTHTDVNMISRIDRPTARNKHGIHLGK